MQVDNPKNGIIGNLNGLSKLGCLYLSHIKEKLTEEKIMKASTTSADTSSAATKTEERDSDHLDPKRYLSLGIM
jgi:hypothetical protein